MLERFRSGLAALTKSNATMSQVSCATPGNCAATGNYTDAHRHQQVFITPGNCALAGSYFTADGNEQAFVASEVNGAWGHAIEVPGTGARNGGGRAQALSVSCPSAGTCAAGGFYEDAMLRFHAFVSGQTRGQWGQARELPAPGALGTNDVRVASVSCPSPGNCAVTGRAIDAAGHEQVFVASEAGGTWGPAQQIPGFGDLNGGQLADATSISCASAGNCVTVGQLANPAFVAYVTDERSGGWDLVQQVFGGTGDFNISGFAELASVSCRAPGNCAAAGDYLTASNTKLAFVVNEVNGSWGNAMRVPGITTLATGGFADASSVSCASPGNCVAVGTYEDAHGDQPFVADQSTATATALALSAATVRNGHEQGEKISVQVRPRTSGTPGGTVTVCVITLAGGKGACALKATQLRPGSYQLTATYAGSTVYSRSASAARKLTVTR